MISYWTFNDGKNIERDYAYNNKGVIIGSLSQTTGRASYALSFNGLKKNYFKVYDSDTLDLSSKFTLEAWVNFKDITTNDVIIWKDRNYRLILPSKNPDRIQVSFYNKDAWRDATSFDAVISTSGWYHIVGTVDASKQPEVIKIYVNGNLVGSESGFKGENGIMISKHPLNIGCNHKGESCINAKIDDVAIYDRVLSQSEIKEHYTYAMTGSSINSNTNSIVTGYIGAIGYLIDNPSSIMGELIQSRCGDKICNDNETHKTCSSDCKNVVFTCKNGKIATDLSITVGTNINYKYNCVVSNEIVNLEIESEDITITEINITPTSLPTTPTVSIDVVEEIEVDEPEGIPYQYIDMSTDVSFIGYPMIDFKVPVSWMIDNNQNEDTVKLQRHNNGKWSELPTAYRGKDENYYYFYATTPGFSTFVVSGTPNKFIITNSIILIIVSIIIFILILLLNIKQKKRKKRKKKR